MMMDVLAHFDELKVCVAYELDGKRLETFPSHADQLRRCKPIYETISGWNQPVDDVRQVSDFPSGALDYVKRIEELVGIPVGVLSVGPDRSQTIFTESADVLGLKLPL
jgi:adenylosuccinate synthase